MSTRRRGERPTAWLPLMALLLVTAALYSRSIHGGFFLDDALFLTNTNVTDPAKWAHFLSFEGFRTLTYLSLHLNYRWSGPQPLSYHAINLSIHLLNCCLVLICLERMLNGFKGKRQIHPREPEWALMRSAAAWTGTAVFALHPLQTETVNTIYQRSTLLAAFFGLAGLALLLVCGATVAALLLALLLWGLAVLSKESAVVLPLAWLVVLRQAEGREVWGLRKPLAWGAGILLVAAAAVTAAFRLAGMGEKTLGFLSPQPTLAYLWTQSWVLLRYLSLMLWPRGQNVDHHVRPFTGPDSLSILSAAAALAIICGVLYLYRQRQMEGLAGVLFLIFLAPTSSLMPSSDLMFEHRLYLAMLGAGLLPAALLLRWFPTVPGSRLKPWMIPLVIAAWLIPWTWMRNALWENPVALLQDAIAKSPAKVRPRLALGTQLLRTDAREAREVLQGALALDAGNCEVLNNLGLASQLLRDPDQAMAFWKQAIGQDPGFAPAYSNIAGLMYRAARYEESEKHYRRVLELRPNEWEAHLNLANVCLRLSRFTESESLLRRALEKEPRAVLAMNNLAAVLQNRGAAAEAEAWLNQALKISPAYLEARMNRVQLLHKMARDREALEELDRLELQDQSGTYHNRCAQMRALIGRP